MKFSTLLILIILLLFALSSCNEKSNPICQTEQSEELLKEYFDLEIFDDDFQIMFYGRGGWGAFENRIEIIKKNKGFESNSKLISSRYSHNVNDTLSNRTILNKIQLDSLLYLVGNLNCHPFNLEKHYTCFDCDSHNILIKNGNQLRAWTWYGGEISRDTSKNQFIDSVKVNATRIEGMMYRLAGFNSIQLYYRIDDTSEREDSVDFHIFPSLESYNLKSIEVKHARYPLNEFDSDDPDNHEFYSKHFTARISCIDTLSFIEDAEVFVVTKDDEFRVANKIFKYK